MTSEVVLNCEFNLVKAKGMNTFAVQKDYIGKNCFKSIHQSEVRNLVLARIQLNPAVVPSWSAKKVKLQMYYKYYQFNKVSTQFKTLYHCGWGPHVRLRVQHGMGSQNNFASVLRAKSTCYSNMYLQ